MGSRNVSVSREDRPFLSSGAENFLRQLKSYAGKSRRGAFPRGWDQTYGRNKAPTPAEWLVECLDASDMEPDCCAIDDNIACFAVASWNPNNQITYLCLHSVVALESTIEDLCCDHKLPCHYYRLEADSSQPGPMFKEPFPHVHVGLKGAPRFSFNRTPGGFIVQEFVEFLYRNYLYSKWETWAQSVFEAACADTGADPEVFELITRAFGAGNKAVLADCKPGLDQLRRSLQAELRSACDLRLPDEDRELLDYPLIPYR